MKKKVKDQDGAMKEAIGLGAGPRFFGPPFARIVEFRKRCMMDINEHLLKREQEQMMNLTKAFEEGRDLSTKALCAYVTMTQIGHDKYNLIPDKYAVKAALNATLPESPKRRPLDEVMKAMQELVPFAPHKEIQTAAIRELEDADLREDYRQFQKSELRKAYDRAFILKKLREGNTEPLRKRVEFLLDDLSPHNLRRTGNKIASRAGNAVRHAAEKTIGTFKESVNRFLPGRMKFQINSQER